jgi:hypothetical protein
LAWLRAGSTSAVGGPRPIVRRDSADARGRADNSRRFPGCVRICCDVLQTISSRGNCPPSDRSAIS